MSELPASATIDKPRSHGPAIEQILHETEAICESPPLRASHRLQRLLHYLVNETLAGRAAEIKAYTIAVEVFDRGVDFDAGHDPYVRNLGVRLRKALAEYEETRTEPGEARIEIPKGSYVPLFFRTGIVDPDESIATERIVDRTFRAAQRLPGSPAVYLTSFEVEGFDARRAHGLADRIAAGLARYPTVRVFGPFGGAGSSIESRLHGVARRNSPSSILGGSLRRDGSRVRLSLHLNDAKYGEHLWAAQNDFSDEEISIFEFEDRVTAWVCESLAGVGGALPRIAVNRAADKAPDRLSPYDAAAKIYCWGDSLDDASFTEAFRALEVAARATPESAALKAVLSDLYFSDYLSAIGMTSNENDELDRAEELAREATALDPDGAEGWWALGQVHFCRDRPEAFHAAFEKAMTLNPANVNVSASYALFLAGSSHHGKAVELYTKISAITGHLPPWAHVIPFLASLENGEFDGARMHAEQLHTPGLMWGPLARAAAYAALGRKSDAAREKKDLLARQPRFESEGREIAGRLIRSESLREKVLAGIG